MMKKIENLDFYDLLEVSPSATTQDIHKAYERLRKIYDPNSIALYSLFTPEETAAMQLRLEEAYRTLIFEDKRREYDAALKDLSERPEQEAAASTQTDDPNPAQQHLALTEDIVPLPAPAEAPPQAAQAAPALPPAGAVEPVPEFTGEFTGPAIKSLREQGGRDLRTIAGLTKISIRYLESIEEENFRKLPARTYIRGFLMLYAKTLGYDAEKLAGDYLKRYDEAMKPAKK
jgi:curved DNA-binding protein CbpA